MGYKTAKIVADYGGTWLNGNEYMLLNTFAWQCFDLPKGPEGEPALQVFMSAQKVSNKAFGVFMPDISKKPESELSASEILDAKAHKVANNRITKARSSLIKMGVLKELRKSGNWSTGMYELDLDRIVELGQQHFEKSSAEHDARKSECPVDNSPPGELDSVIADLESSISEDSYPQHLRIQNHRILNK